MPRQLTNTGPGSFGLSADGVPGRAGPLADRSSFEGRRYRFADFELDTSPRTLLDRQTGQELPLRRSEYALLLALVMHPGRVLTRDHLRDLVSGRSSDAYDRSIDVLIGRLRRKLSDYPRSPRLIATVAGIGYRFLPEVERIADQAPTNEAVSGIAIEAFRHLESDRELHDLERGLAEELRVAIGQLPGMVVVDGDGEGRSRRASLIMRGSLRRSATRIRVTVSLVDVAQGVHIWSGSFDALWAEDRLSVEMRLASQIAGQMPKDKLRSDLPAQASSPPADMEPRYSFIRLFEGSGGTAGDLSRAMEATRQAIDDENEKGVALAFHSFLVAMKHSQSVGRPAEIRDAVRMAEEAVCVAPGDPLALRYAAHTLAYLGRDFRRSLDVAEAAVALAPESSKIVLGSAWAHTYACRPVKAVDLFHRAMAARPSRADTASALSGLGLAHFVAKEYEVALQWSERCIVTSPGWARAYRFAAVSLANMNRPEHALSMGRRLRAIAPGFQPHKQINPLREEDAAWRFAKGLEQACPQLS